MSKKKHIGSLIGVAVVSTLLIVAGMYTLNQNRLLVKQEESYAMLKKYGIGDLSVQEVVHWLDQRIDEPESLKGGIRGTELVMYDGEKEYKLALPKDEFYLSFAPYQNNTHPCANHNLITCRGEMVEETFDVRITDKAGKEIVNEQMTSMKNGFIGVWLPKNIEATIFVSYGAKTASAVITTFDDSDTCLTTPLQLS